MYSVSPRQPPGHCAHHQSSSYRTNRMDSTPYLQSNDDHCRPEFSRVRQVMFGNIYDYIWQWSSQYYGIPVERSVRELAGGLEDILWKTAASEEEYLNLETMSSHVEVLLGSLTQHRQQSLQCNGACTSIIVPTLNMPSPFGECDMSDIVRFPNQMIPEYSTAAVCNQTNMIPNSLPMCNGTAITKSEPISELLSHPKPVQAQSIGGQNCLMMRSASFVNSNDFPFGSRDQTVQFPNDSANSGLRNIYSHTINDSGPDMSEVTLFQTGCNEREQLLIGQHQQTGDGNELCSNAPSILENHNCPTSFLVRVQSDCSSNVPGMYTQCQSNLRSSLMPSYLSSPHPEEAMAIQPQVNQSGNGNCSLPVSDTLGQFRGYDVHLNSQSRPQQFCAAGMLETITGVYNRDTRSKIVSKEGYVAPETASIGINTEPTLSRDATCTSKDFNAECKIKKARQATLLGLCHAHSCALSTTGKCPLQNCIKYKELLQHMVQCKGASCASPRCSLAKTVITHYRQCKDPVCSLCVPVKVYLSKLKRSLGTQPGMNRGQCNTNITSTMETSEDFQPPPKRVKIDVPEVCILTTEKPVNGVSTDCTLHSAESSRSMDSDAPYELGPPAKPELKKLNGSSQEDPSIATHRDSKIDTWACNGISVEALENITRESLKHEELLHTSNEHAALPTDPVTESTEHPKVNCTSLAELFTPDQVKQHIMSLRQWADQNKVNADKKQSMEQSLNQNSCQLCAAEELNFEPRPIYCTQCCSRIKRQAVYYSLGTGDTCYNFCTTCHTAIPRENSVIYGVTFSKSELEKRKNNEHIQEPWVQCDKCLGWQHQICALFNSRMNGDGQAKYTCLNCYIKEIERGDCVMSSQTAFRGAKDLPRTALSDHIERRLGRRLAEGAVSEKVCEDLVVRVVLSVDKKLEVKKKFLEIFEGDEYPAEFPYKSKVILMFQNIEGLEVCLFGMYVQEFGSECEFPNKRRVYISYLDSVKYFRPDVKLMNGEGLRTFVYHEVLIGYLEYCKIRGFTSCYIWVCPPPKGEDYILYCHPESQRTPKKDKLREWYFSMLKKAVKENIVVEIGNLYDNFLALTCESKAKLSAARLPYFDGDYWPGIAEEKLQRFCDEGEKGQSKKSASKKPLPKRTLRTRLHSDISEKDMFLIDEIGKTMYPMKEDFIMVHLQNACTHCCMFIISGNCWQCEQCSSFRLCDRCYEAEQCLDDRDRHPLKKPFRHLLRSVELLDVPSDTKDVDGIIESDIFDSRYEFLNFCKGNHYQNDTLRRAKHSSMMLLYHLHNPTAPAFVTPCNVCHLDIEPGRGLICDVCFDYEICSRCYERLGDSNHPHKLTKHSSSHRMMEARSQVKKMNDLIVHVSDCRSPSCTYADCRKVKWLFHHGNHCTKRALKGCVTCKKMWYLLRIHSKNCLESKCRVPCCSDLKMHKRRLHQQLEAQRLAAVTEMSRQDFAMANAES